ncbi:GNAT family N-acetyltransferase [Nonomuraea turkmeniaca]|uniref:GNAT family N-acetyltransferase n=1 Tax=Nonomuraea turkmeniaca TaxID=103838 RepID=A0A5S4FKM0_9ACTN|nr:GNAT family N-acyltransferase [Nonomuraea turkmeniaca]TMR21268.1 GNAT family N-acetyltransferase [Nonomuraea turkmeniaca]
MTISLDTGRYTVGMATSPADLRAAQRLRYEVFAGEMGARLDSPVSGLDADRFDAYCDHLIVRDGDEVVGTYRLLPPGRADRLYSDTEFDLRNLAPIRKGLVEAGRTCVHPGHRDGAVMALMWAGIARYMVDGGHQWLAGCCSVPLDDQGTVAAAVAERVPLGPEEYRVMPRDPWRPDRRATERADRFVPPALLRGYLRLGSWVCGAPAHDRDFGTADFFLLLSMARVNQRYLRYFLGEAAVGAAR